MSNGEKILDGLRDAIETTRRSMRVSLPGLFANIKAALPRDEGGYRFALDEVLQHLRETVAGEHTLDEFAEHYCLKAVEKIGESEERTSDE